MPSNNPFLVFVKKYQENPELFVRQVLKVKPDPWQIELLKSVKDKDRKISVRAGHGVGKSAAASWVIIWYFKMIIL